MAQMRVEKYNDEGLYEVLYIEVPDEPTIEEQIAEKEALLIQIYEEVQRLKQQLNQPS